MAERVQKILARRGVASRRRCEDLIREGKVTVNGKTVSIGATAGPTDTITVDGKDISEEKKTYLLLHKPRGFVTTVSETHGMRTVMDLVKTDQRVFPVGRLDKHTEGLLLLTNDGELANRMTHPRYEVEKSYVAWLDKPFLHGYKLKDTAIDGRKVAITRWKRSGERLVSLTVIEGRKHVIRRLFERLGYRVVRLLRTQIGPLKLGWMGAGKVRELKDGELRTLRRALKLRNDRARPAQSA